MIRKLLVRKMLIWSRPNIFTDQENAEQEDVDQEITGQENADQENADQEIY